MLKQNEGQHSLSLLSPGLPRHLPKRRILRARLSATATFGAVDSAAPAASLRAAAIATPSTPFTECPAIGEDSSCGILIQVTDSATNVLQDPSQGPYDGSDDTLIGVVNSSTKPLTHITLSSDTDLFGFDLDGICSGGYVGTPAGCPFGPTGYEGPNTSFSDISADAARRNRQLHQPTRTRRHGLLLTRGTALRGNRHQRRARLR